jgi:hypothetical protein
MVGIPYKRDSICVLGELFARGDVMRIAVMREAFFWLKVCALIWIVAALPSISTMPSAAYELKQTTWKAVLALDEMLYP